MVFDFAAFGKCKNTRFWLWQAKTIVNYAKRELRPPLHMAGVANLSSATQKRCKLQRLGAPWRVRSLSPEQPKRDPLKPKSLE